MDGFRVDVAHGLVKAGGCPTGTAPRVLGGLGRTARRRRCGTRTACTRSTGDWRRVLDEYPGERILVAEAWVEPAERLARYVRPDEMHQAFNFAFLRGALERRPRCAR